MGDLQHHYFSIKSQRPTSGIYQNRFIEIHILIMHALILTNCLGVNMTFSVLKYPRTYNPAHKQAAKGQY